MCQKLRAAEARARYRRGYRLPCARSSVQSHRRRSLEALFLAFLHEKGNDCLAHALRVCLDERECQSQSVEELIGAFWREEQDWRGWVERLASLDVTVDDVGLGHVHLEIFRQRHWKFVVHGILDSIVFLGFAREISCLDRSWYAWRMGRSQRDSRNADVALLLTPGSMSCHNQMYMEEGKVQQKVGSSGIEV